MELGEMKASVEHLQKMFALSQRRACGLVGINGQHRDIAPSGTITRCSSAWETLLAKAALWLSPAADTPHRPNLGPRLHRKSELTPGRRSSNVDLAN
jgi:hypothetical protein